ncbi:MAG: class II aldolase/adducin family protein [Sphaerochaetaceae bacterium]
MEKLDVNELIVASQRYGMDARFVLLGGGNTSLKDDEVMYVKASGHALGTISRDGFVKMSIPRLNQIWDRKYPVEQDAREKEVLADMMAARCDGQESRPSVEALLHAIIPFRYVFHMHPALINGVTCGQSGKEAVEKLFADSIWIPLVNPGYILAKTVREAQAVYRESQAGEANLIFLQNHGVFVAADTIDEIDAIYNHLIEVLERYVTRKPNFNSVKVNGKRVENVKKVLTTFFEGTEEIPFVMNRELAARLRDRETFYPISSAYTPDHIVYSGFAPLWIDEALFSAVDPDEAILKVLEEYKAKNLVPPKIVVVQNTGAFAVNEIAMTLFLDTLKVAAFVESFGGPRFMDEDQINFIRNWEVESYRSKLLAK